MLYALRNMDSEIPQYIMLGAVYLLFMGLTLPFPVPPQDIPVGVFIVAFAMNVFLANTQKRV